MTRTLPRHDIAFLERLCDPMLTFEEAAVCVVMDRADDETDDRDGSGAPGGTPDRATSGALTAPPPTATHRKMPGSDGSGLVPENRAFFRGNAEI